MFTGIIQGTAKIISIKEKKLFRTHCVYFPKHLLCNLLIGASVSHNGCCLTVSNIQGNHVSFDIIQETLKISNLGKLKVGDIVNIERALKFGDEIGGHLLSGHIMTMGLIHKIIKFKNNVEICFKLKNKELLKYILHKGFIAIDGISLTVGEINKDCFSVHLIPETIRRTTLAKKKNGNYVNIEIDSHTQTIVATTERIIKNLTCLKKAL